MIGVCEIEVHELFLGSERCRGVSDYCFVVVIVYSFFFFDFLVLFIGCLIAVLQIRMIAIDLCCVLFVCVGSVFDTLSFCFICFYLKQYLF